MKYTDIMFTGKPLGKPSWWEVVMVHDVS